MREAIARDLLSFHQSYHPEPISRGGSAPSLTVNGYDKLDKKKTHVLWIYADWCGHCNAMSDAWKAASKRGASHAVWHRIDGDGDGKALARKLGVSGFPTIKKLKGSKLTEHVGARTADALLRFARE